MALAALCTGLVLTLLSQLIVGQGPGRMLEWVVGHPLAVVGSVLFIALWVLIIGGLTRNLWVGGFLTALVILILSLITYFKALIAGEPLTLADFALMGRLGQIAGLNSDSIKLTATIVWAIVLALVWNGLLFFFRRQTRLAWRGSLITALSCALAFMLLFCLPSVVNVWLYSPVKAPVNQSYSQTHVNRRCGVVLGLWRGVVYQDKLVDDYSQASMEAVLSRVEDATVQVSSTERDQQPNVILILSESFFDVTTLDNVTYSKDPLAGFHALQQEGVSGTFHTRTLGYGTCNIELELLTGINDKLLSYGENLSQWPASRYTRLPSVPELLSRDGYYTAAIHTFNDEIYQREPRFRSMGFDETFFSEDFWRIDPDAAQASDYWGYLNTKIAGEFYGDDYMTDLLIRLYEEKKESGPVFLYGISMENHTPYTQNKYKRYEYAWKSQQNLTREARGTLNAVTQGAADASQALVKLTDYFRESDEPTVIIFYGDHRPGLGLEDGSSLYSQLGMCDADSSRWDEAAWQELYATEYLIWANDPTLLPGDAGEKKDQSSNYLGLEILKAAGADLPLYWKYLQAISEDTLMYTGAYYLDRENHFSFILPTDAKEELTQKLSDLAALYHDAFLQQYITRDLWS